MRQVDELIYERLLDNDEEVACIAFAESSGGQG
jgi:hypothetical protein